MCLGNSEFMLDNLARLLISLLALGNDQVRCGERKCREAIYGDHVDGAVSERLFGFGQSYIARGHVRG